MEPGCAGEQEVAQEVAQPGRPSRRSGRGGAVAGAPATLKVHLTLPPDRAPPKEVQERAWSDLCFRKMPLVTGEEAWGHFWVRGGGDHQGLGQGRGDGGEDTGWGGRSMPRDAGGRRAALKCCLGSIVGQEGASSSEWGPGLPPAGGPQME